MQLGYTPLAKTCRQPGFRGHHLTIWDRPAQLQVCLKRIPVPASNRFQIVLSHNDQQHLQGMEVRQPCLLQKQD